MSHHEWSCRRFPDEMCRNYYCHPSYQYRILGPSSPAELAAPSVRTFRAEVRQIVSRFRKETRPMSAKESYETRLLTGVEVPCGMVVEGIRFEQYVLHSDGRHHFGDGVCVRPSPAPASPS
jgi:hypothetical protein